MRIRMCYRRAIRCGQAACTSTGMTVAVSGMQA